MKKNSNETNKNDFNPAENEEKKVLPFDKELNRRNNYFYKNHHKGWLQFNPNTK